MDNPFKSPAVLSLCPGILGLERGVERSIGKLRIAAYVEIEAFIVANLVAGMEAGVLAPVPIWTNVKTFNAKPFHGKIHGIIGGYPCQPFSTAGRRNGKNDPRHLWPYFRDIIRHIRPSWCFFENVEGHLSLGYEQVKRELEALDFKVKEGIYSAAEVGAPHRRKRLFSLAVQKNVGDPNSKGFQKPLSSKQQSLQHPIEPFTWSSINRTAATKWPAKQNEQQCEWEERRLTQPGMGCTIDGYNFREDLLRALGNSVVEQTAELAFKSLLQKHFLC